MLLDYLKNVKEPAIINQISCDSLKETISKNPNKEKIIPLYSLDRKSNKKEYDERKVTLPCIKVHANFDGYGDTKHFKNFTGLLYFDIDDFEGSTLEETMKKLFLEFGDMILMIGKSVGNRGIFFLIKLKNPEVLTLENFNSVHYYFRKLIFKKFNLDDNASGVNRNFIIPSDENIFFNKEAEEVHLDLKKVCSTEKSIKIDTGKAKYSLNSENEFKGFIPLSEIVKKMNNQTFIDTGEYDLIIEEHQCAKVYFRKIILDSKKHSTYRGIINAIVFNNPDFTLLEVQSYINHVNEKYTNGSPMMFKEMMRFTELVYNAIKSTGEIYGTKKRGIILNRNLTKREKTLFANKVNGKLRKNKSLIKIKSAIEELEKEDVNSLPKNNHNAQIKKESIKKIEEAIRQLINEGKKDSNASISKITGLHRNTISKLRIAQSDCVNQSINLNMEEEERCYTTSCNIECADVIKKLKGRLCPRTIKEYFQLVKENDIHEITKIEIDGCKINDLSTCEWINELPSSAIGDKEIDLTTIKSPLNTIQSQKNHSCNQIIDAVSEQEETIDETALLELGFVIGADGRWRFNLEKKGAVAKSAVATG